MCADERLSLLENVTEENMRVETANEVGQRLGHLLVGPQVMGIPDRDQPETAFIHGVGFCVVCGDLETHVFDQQVVVECKK